MICKSKDKSLTENVLLTFRPTVIYLIEAFLKNHTSSSDAELDTQHIHYDN